MSAELHDFLSRDHERLDALLSKCLRRDGTVDQESYVQFRGGLLRHIAIEEKILLPICRQGRGESELERQLHRDHAVLAALLVPPPTKTEIARVRAILEAHNPLEEGAGGFYDIMESLAGDRLAALMDAVRAVPLAPHADTPVTRRSIEQLVREAEEGRRRLSATHGRSNK